MMRGDLKLIVYQGGEVWVSGKQSMEAPEKGAIEKADPHQGADNAHETCCEQGQKGLSRHVDELAQPKAGQEAEDKAEWSGDEPGEQKAQDKDIGQFGQG